MAEHEQTKEVNSSVPFYCGALQIPCLLKVTRSSHTVRKNKSRIENDWCISSKSSHEVAGNAHPYNFSLLKEGREDCRSDSNRREREKQGRSSGKSETFLSFSFPRKQRNLLKHKWGVRFLLNALFDFVLRLVVLSILVINIWHSDVKNVIRSRPRGW